VSYAPLALSFGLVEIHITCIKFYVNTFSAHSNA